jgi:predicted CXXCH cytochrome family protein
MIASTTALISLILVLVASPARAAAPSSEEIESCLGCHGDRGLTVKLPSGETLPLFVDQAAYARSVHGDKVGCLECHVGMSSVPHHAKPFRTLRELTLVYYEGCKRCHFANYTKSLDSVHFTRLARGDARAPVCVDCHSAHAIMRPDVPRSRISQTCARCHQEVFAAYAKSVHGKALLEGKNGDVPVCTDCHRSHNIGDPRTPGFLSATPELCGKCHTNERIMKKYGLSTKVLSTYLSDFHGVTVALRRESGATAGSGPTAPLCIDCHGIHDIGKVRGPGPNTMQANLVAVCRKCHSNATENFPAAWLSHYEPSWQRAPIVYATMVFYKIFIPFVIGGLVLQILLHLWRVVVNR